MWTQIFVVFFFGGFVGLDTTAAWQVLFSHPLLACSLIGLIFGEPGLGIFFGIIFELIWLYDLPIGGAKFPEGNLSSFIGLMIALASLPNQSDLRPWLVLFCSAYAVIVAYFYGLTIVIMRKNNFFLIKKADQYAEVGDDKQVVRMHLLGALHAYFHGAFWGLFFFLVGYIIINELMKIIPVASFELSHLQAIYLGVGLFLMLQLFFSSKKIHFLLLGILVGIGIGILI